MEFVTNRAPMGTPKCYFFYGKYINSEKQTDTNKKKGGAPKRLIITKIFAKKDDGRATTKISQSDFDGFSCCFCMTLMIALGDI